MKQETKERLLTEINKLKAMNDMDRLTRKELTQTINIRDKLIKEKEELYNDANQFELFDQ